MARVVQIVLGVVLLLVVVRVVGVAAGRVALRLRADPAAKVVRVGRGQPESGLHALLEKVRLEHKLPALAGAILKDGRLAEVAAVGARRAGDPTPVTDEDLWHIGSCGKAMTATLMALLVEDGLLRWDSTIGEVLGPAVPAMDGAWSSVRLEQLLTHTAGVPADLRSSGLWARLWTAAETEPPVEQRRMLVEGVLAAPPVHGPGTAYLYANAGYTLAAAMAERVTGKAWEDLMRERIFGPLEMTSAGFGAPGTGESLDQPRGHTRGGEPVEPGVHADNPAAIGPGGTMHFSMRDWASFVRLHLQGARAGVPGLGGEAPLLLPAESFARLHTPPASPPGDYAMGWGVATRPWARGDFEGATGRVLTHSGSNTTWFAVVWIAPEKNLAVMAATNTGVSNAPKACDEAVWAMIRRVLGDR